MTIQQIITQIEARRRLLKITQEDLAELSGVSLRTIKTLESGPGNPTIGILLKVLESIGLTLELTERVRHE